MTPRRQQFLARQFLARLGELAKPGVKPRTTSLLPGHESINSPQMNPTQKQFSLNRGASKKQFPVSSLVGLLVCAVMCAATASSLGEDVSAAAKTPDGRHYFFAFGKAAPGNPPVMTRRLMKAIDGVEKGINAGGNFHWEILTDPKVIHNGSITARLRSYHQELSSQDSQSRPSARGSGMTSKPTLLRP